MNATRSERHQVALNVRRLFGAKLSPWSPRRRLSDTELAAYIAEVRAAHPNATWQGELEFAYWCVGLSIGRDKWRRAWKAT